MLRRSGSGPTRLKAFVQLLSRRTNRPGVAASVTRRRSRQGATTAGETGALPQCIAREELAVDPGRRILVLNAMNPFEMRRGFFRSSSVDQQGHALPGFATFRELQGHQKRPRSSWSSFLNRASQVRVLPGAPRTRFEIKRLARAVLETISS